MVNIGSISAPIYTVLHVNIIIESKKDIATCLLYPKKSVITYSEPVGFF